MAAFAIQQIYDMKANARRGGKLTQNARMYCKNIKELQGICSGLKRIMRNSVYLKIKYTFENKY